MCGSEAPHVDDLPPEDRTHRGGEHHPTIIQEEPPFEHVVWINPDSKESIRIRQARGGTKGAASIATKTFREFVAVKCFEILKRLKVRQDLNDQAVTELQFRSSLSMAEMACADFIDGAFAIADDLAGPDLEASA
jgi:hypothetical protein